MSRRKRVVIATIHEVVGAALAAAFKARGNFVTALVSIGLEPEFSGRLLQEFSRADLVVMELGPNRLTQEVTALASLRSNPTIRIVTVLTEDGKATLFNPARQTAEVLDNPSVDTLVDLVTKPGCRSSAPSAGRDAYS
ncbi:MAG: hypothetical protein M1305_03540 [Candidatus Marsarchaeota archaeon]|nr:hypothetical protein [Candidatus Marsarchaeota archaeon]